MARSTRLDAILVLLLIVIALAVAAALAAPFLRPGGDADASAGEQVAELEARKEAKYREIRDAELDYRTGKLSAEDHQALDRALRREAIAILEEIEASAEGAKHETLGGGEAAGDIRSESERSDRT